MQRRMDTVLTKIAGVNRRMDHWNIMKRGMKLLTESVLELLQPKVSNGFWKWFYALPEKVSEFETEALESRNTCACGRHLSLKRRQQVLVPLLVKYNKSLSSMLKQIWNKNADQWKKFSCRCNYMENTLQLRWSSVVSQRPWLLQELEP